MADFQVAVAKTLEYEGGLVDNPEDPGGLTNFGIALNEHPELTAADIRALTAAGAAAMYHKQYWPDLYDQIEDQALAATLFDFGVTSGQATAVKALQAVLVASHALAAAPDGVFGPRTLSSINLSAARALRVAFTAARLQFYASLGKPQFLHSWFARTIDVLLG